MDHVLPAPAETDDAPLLATFDAVYVHERGALVRLAVTMVDDPERAAEIVHDAFEKLYVRWARVRDPGAYLRTTVVNRCRSELRRRAVQRRQPPPRHETTEMTLADDGLLAALQRLKPRQRVALSLRFLVDLPDDEIAVLMGARPGTVRSLISRGLAELRKEVER